MSTSTECQAGRGFTAEDAEGAEGKESCKWGGFPLIQEWRVRVVTEPPFDKFRAKVLLTSILREMTVRGHENDELAV